MAKDICFSSTKRSMPLSPRHTRRWFTFGLGTLLTLVTLFCIWLGWALNWARERQQVLKALRLGPESRAMVATFDNLPPGVATQKPWRTMPLTMKVFRSEQIGWIHLSPSFYSQGDREHIEALFPEATVILRSAER
jgi:hypothetical protein